MYDLGIIGGMGPLATEKIFSSIIKKTKANNDQEHISIVILNNTAIPDRSKAILNNGKSPVEELNKCISELVNLKVKNFIIGCNTAHAFVDELKIPKRINFINLVDETLKKVKSLYINKPIVILSTLGTIKSDIYRTNINAKNLNIIYPNNDFQKIIMDYIYGIKSGNDIYTNLEVIKLNLDQLQIIYPDCIFLLACTEMSLLKSKLSEKYLVLDAVDILLDAAILSCGFELK